MATVGVASEHRDHLRRIAAIAIIQSLVEARLDHHLEATLFEVATDTARSRADIAPRFISLGASQPIPKPHRICEVLRHAQPVRVHHLVSTRREDARARPSTQRAGDLAPRDPRKPSDPPRPGRDPHRRPRSHPFALARSPRRDNRGGVCTLAPVVGVGWFLHAGHEQLRMPPLRSSVYVAVEPRTSTLSPSCNSGTRRLYRHVTCDAPTCAGEQIVHRVARHRARHRGPETHLTGSPFPAATETTTRSVRVAGHAPTLASARGRPRA